MLNEEESPVEVMSKIIWPIINQCRCSILDTTQDKLHKLDKKIWEEELNDFVPNKVYDVHTHIYQWQSNLDKDKNTSIFENQVIH